MQVGNSAFSHHKKTLKRLEKQLNDHDSSTSDIFGGENDISIDDEDEVDALIGQKRSWDIRNSKLIGQIRSCDNSKGDHSEHIQQRTVTHAENKTKNDGYENKGSVINKYTGINKVEKETDDLDTDDTDDLENFDKYNLDDVCNVKQKNVTEQPPAEVDKKTSNTTIVKPLLESKVINNEASIYSQ